MADSCTGASKAQIDKWIAQLGSPVEQERVAAEKCLRADSSRASKPLIAALKDDNWETRAGAAKLLGGLKDKRAVVPLCKLLKDEIWAVRLQAVKALGQLKDKRADKHLAAAINDTDPVVAKAALEALGGINTNLSKEVLVKMLQSSNSSVKASIIRTLHKAKTKGLYPEYLKALGDEDPTVRRAAMFAIKYPQLADHRAVKPLLNLLNDPSDTPGRVAILLGRIGDKRAVKPLMEVTKHHPRRDARRDAITALVRIEGKAMVPHLNKLLAVDADNHQTILRALMRLCDRRCAGAVIGILEYKNARTQAYAARLLSCLGDKRAVDPLIKLLENSHKPAVQYAAVISLTRLGDRRAVEPFIRAMTNKNHHVRAAAVTGLGLLGGDKAYQTVVKALKSPDPKIRSAAVRVLGETAGEKVYDLLLKATADKDYYVVFSAVNVMKTIGDKRAIEPLAKVLKTRHGYSKRFKNQVDYPGCGSWGSGYVSDEFIRWEAVKALGKIKDPAVVPVLLAALNDRESVTRRYAIRALGKIGDKRTIKPLTKIFMNQRGHWLRSEAAVALSRFGIRTIFRTALELLPAFGVYQKQRQQELAQALVDIATKPDIELLRKQLQSKKVNTRISAAIVLGLVKDKTFTKAIIALLGDSSEKVRQSAALALGQINDRSAVKPLIKLLQSKDKRTVSKAATALGMIGDKRAIEPLIRTLNNCPTKTSSKITIPIANALGSLGGSRAFKVLLKILKSNSPRPAALGILGDKRAIKPLLKAFEATKYSFSFTRIRTVRAIAKLDGKKSVDPLIWILLSNPYGYEKDRAEAAKLLGKIGDKRAIAPLKYALRDKHPKVRQAAREALKKILKDGNS